MPGPAGTPSPRCTHVRHPLNSSHFQDEESASLYTWLQVVTLGDSALTQRYTTEYLDDLESRAAKTVVAVNAVTYISDSEAGGLTFKGCVAFFRKLPFMRGLRELRVQGVGAAVASAALSAQMLSALSAGLHELPGLQVRSWPRAPRVSRPRHPPLLIVR